MENGKKLGTFKWPDGKEYELYERQTKPWRPGENGTFSDHEDNVIAEVRDGELVDPQSSQS